MASTTVTAPAAHETAVSPMPPSWAAFPRLTERSYMDPDTSLHEVSDSARTIASAKANHLQLAVCELWHWKQSRGFEGMFAM